MHERRLGDYRAPKAVLRVRPSSNVGLVVVPSEDFGILYVKLCILGNIFAIIDPQNRSILLR